MAAEILEAAMLICFGFSWPMSVWKNIKAKSAKNMSLPFIMLICSGYIAGIAAKIITHNISYVLVVYFINLAIVSVNVVVYFINKRYDRMGVKKNLTVIPNDYRKVVLNAEKQVLNRKVTSK